MMRSGDETGGRPTLPGDDGGAAQLERHLTEASAAQLGALIAGLNAVVWEGDPVTRRIRFVNDRIEEMLGRPAADWVADPELWRRAIHPDDRERVLAAVRAAVDSGEDFTLTYRAHAADGRVVWLRHLGHVARDGTGTPTALHAVLIDVTDQKRREEASALLAATGRLLAAPGPVEDRLGAVAELTVGVLCERASVWLRGDDGRYRTVAAAPAAFAPQVLSLPPVAVPEPMQERYRTGRPFVIDEVDDDMRRRAAQDAAHYRAIVRLGTRTVLVVPLLVGGTVVGLFTLVTNAGERRYDDADLELAAELGTRLAGTVAAERLATHQRDLHELTLRLSASGTLAEAATELSSGLRTVLGAHVATVAVLGDDGLLHTQQVAGYPAERVEAFAAMRLSAPYPLTEAVRTGRPVWLHDRAAWQARYPELMDALLPETQAAAAIPLVVGSRVLGALGVSFPGPREFDTEERGFLQTLAGQAAIAVERAALADSRREIAETLQQSLLPRSLPRLDRLAVSARYLPGAFGTSAGGDWYDVLPLGGGRIALVVGDVVGEGAPAAAVMGQLRSALAALLIEGHPPARALELLDRFAATVDGARVSTAACLLLDPGSGRLSYSLAGHPPPLRLGPDGAAFLDGPPGPALGLSAGTGRTDFGTALAPGEILLLYTDGLVERRGTNLDDGLERLAAAATRNWAVDVPALVDAVLAALLDGAGAPDDVAVLAARLLPAPLLLDLPAEPHRLRELRRAVSGWAGEAGLGDRTTGDLQLAVGEAAANAVEHAYGVDAPAGSVHVTIALEPEDSVAVTVTDAGAWRPVPADPGFRGRGLRIIRRLAADVDLRPGPSGTAVRFRVPRAGVPEGVSAGPPVVAAERPAGLRVSDQGETRCLEVSGDFDLAGVGAVRAPLLDELGAASGPVTLDLTGLGHLSSVGIGLLVEAAQQAADAGTPLEVVPPPEGPARRVLDLSGVAEVLFRRP